LTEKAVKLETFQAVKTGDFAMLMIPNKDETAATDVIYSTGNLAVRMRSGSG